MTELALHGLKSAILLVHGYLGTSGRIKDSTRSWDGSSTGENKYRNLVQIDLQTMSFIHVIIK